MPWGVFRRAVSKVIPRPGHADIDEAAIMVTDRIDPGTENGDSGIGPLAEQISRAVGEIGDQLCRQGHN